MFVTGKVRRAALTVFAILLTLGILSSNVDAGDGWGDEDWTSIGEDQLG